MAKQRTLSLVFAVMSLFDIFEAHFAPLIADKARGLLMVLTQFLMHLQRSFIDAH